MSLFRLLVPEGVAQELDEIEAEIQRYRPDRDEWLAVGAAVTWAVREIVKLRERVAAAERQDHLIAHEVGRLQRKASSR